MLTSVFAKTLRDQRRGLFGWGTGTFLSIVLMAALFPTFGDTDVSSLAEQYPDALSELFDIDAMSTGIGFMNAELFSVMLPAMFIIYAVARGARFVAGEEEDGTLAAIVTLPIGRGEVLVHKAAGLIVGVGLLAVVVWVSTWGSSLVFDMDISARDAAMGAVTQWFIGVQFGLISMAVAASTGRRGLAVAVPGALAVGAYVLHIASQLVDQLHGLRWLTPFFAATTGGPLGPGLPWVAWTMPAVGLVALVASVPRFVHRDIRG